MSLLTLLLLPCPQILTVVQGTHAEVLQAQMDALTYLHLELASNVAAQLDVHGTGLHVLPVSALLLGSTEWWV
jgi:hypothetical protein